jgi:gag-polypeptide of LTR copia-type/Domain of unknown function (DUF4219)/Zinc knuckle
VWKRGAPRFPRAHRRRLVILPQRLAVPRMAAMDGMGSIAAMALLDGTNYATWSVRMKFLLVRKGLWSVVEADPTGAKEKELDPKAKAEIALYVGDQDLVTVDDAASAKAAWDALASIYKARTMARRLFLKREMSMLKMQPTEGVVAFVARAKGMWAELLAAGHTVASPAELTWHVLAGLPEGFEAIITVLEQLSETELIMDKVLPKLLQAEQRVGRHAMAGDATALYAKGPKHGGPPPSPFTGKCWKCGKRGHRAKECKEKPTEFAALGIAL